MCCGRKGFPETSFVSICDMLCCVKNPSSVAHNKHCTLLYMHPSVRPSEFRFIIFFSCYDKSKVHFFKRIVCSLTFGDTLAQEEDFVLKTLNINGVQKLFVTTEQKKEKNIYDSSNIVCIRKQYIKWHIAQQNYISATKTLTEATAGQ